MNVYKGITIWLIGLWIGILITGGFYTISEKYRLDPVTKNNIISETVTIQYQLSSGTAVRDYGPGKISFDLTNAYLITNMKIRETEYPISPNTVFPEPFLFACPEFNDPVIGMDRAEALSVENGWKMVNDNGKYLLSYSFELDTKIVNDLVRLYR